MTLTVDSDLNGPSLQFTLTCISTGGPATNVTWTRDSVTVTEGTETVLDDPLTAQYTHTLTVTGSTAGVYTCTVANNKPSNDSASITVHGIYIACASYYVYALQFLIPPVASAPTHLTAVQEGLTSIRVSWSPPSPLGDTTGYRIDYTGGSTGSVDITDSAIDNYLLTDLVMDASYTVTVVATSQHLPSDVVELQVTLSEALLILSKPKVMSSPCVCSLSSSSAQCDCDLHNSYLHLPLLECFQWLSGDQFRGDVERGQQWY